MSEEGEKVRDESPHPLAFYSAGRWLLSQLYIVGWRDLGIVKVGTTSAGRERYGTFLARGGEMLSLTAHKGCDHLTLEERIQEEMDSVWGKAFTRKEDAAPILGRRGSGWLECYSVPSAEWNSVLELLERGEARGEAERPAVRTTGAGLLRPSEDHGAVF